MKTIAIALTGLLFLGIPVGAAYADKQESANGEEVIGLNPGLESSTQCDYQCSEAFEIKCTQSARYLYVLVGDDWAVRHSSRFSDTYVQGQLTGLAPSTMYGKSVATPGYLGLGDGWYLTIIRPGTEGTMKALATVQAVQYFDRLYAIDVWCYSNVYFAYRNASLLKKNDG